MNKKIILIVVAIVFISFFTIYLLQKDAKEDHEQEQVRLFIAPELVDIRFSYQNQEEDIHVSKNDKQVWDVEHAQEDVSNLKLQTMLENMYNLSGHTAVDVSKKAAGISNSSDVITLKSQSGDEQKLTIGTVNEEKDIYYIFDDVTGKIFEIPTSFIESFPTSLVELYDRSIIHMGLEQVNKMSIRNDGRVIELLPTSSYTEEEVRTNLSGWFMHKPYKQEYSMQYQRFTEMIYGMEYLEWKEVIEEGQIDKKKYGLDTFQMAVTFFSEEGEETVLVGDPADEGTSFAMMKDGERVFTIENKLLAPYDGEAMKMIDRFVKIIAVDVLNELMIRTENDKIYRIVADQETSTFTINDVAIEDNEFRQLYKRIAGLSFSAEAKEDVTYDQPAAQMTYTLVGDEKKVIVVDLVDYDAEYYAVYIDGTADFLVKKSEFASMMTEIEQVQNKFQ